MSFGVFIHTFLVKRAQAKTGKKKVHIKEKKNVLYKVYFLALIVHVKTT